MCSLTSNVKSHNHSICIRPDLPPYDVSVTQTVQFKLSGVLAQTINKMRLFTTTLSYDGAPQSTPMTDAGIVEVVS